MSERPAPLAALELVTGDLFERWDKDMRAGKLLTALSGLMSPGYDPRVDLIRKALSDAAPAHDMREALKRIVEATPSNTNSATVEAFQSWVRAVVKTALADTPAPETQHRFGAPPEPVVNPSEAWCDSYAAWYYQEPQT
jgi:hypothetical protein